MHWDGTQWTGITTPSPSGEVYLSAVDALSSTDAWAVGSYVDGNGARLTLIQHWDGSTWSQIASPSPDPTWNQLNGVLVIGASDAWAVGSAGDAALALHWDGQDWLRAELPDLGAKYASLEAVGATSGSDVWAVGTYHGCYDLILHWSGTSWSKDPFSEDSGGRCFDAHGELDAVTVLSDADAWAVGNTGCCGGNSPSIVHWNGEQWTSVPFEADFGGLDELDDIVAISVDDVWAVGSTGDGFTDSKMLIMHWDGTAWSQMTSPTPLKWASGVVGLSASDAWITGDVFLHWTGE
jgi:hypothetical protein